MKTTSSSKGQIKHHSPAANSEQTIKVINYVLPNIRRRKRQSITGSLSRLPLIRRQKVSEGLSVLEAHPVSILHLAWKLKTTRLTTNDVKILNQKDKLIPIFLNFQMRIITGIRILRLKCARLNGSWPSAHPFS